MISKNKIKLIQQLERRKEREEQRLFVGEGPKVVEELMTTFTLVTLVVEEEYFDSYSKKLSDANQNAEIVTVSSDELRKVSFLQHPQHVLGVFQLPSSSFLSSSPSSAGLTLALDGVQDPGNMGTIIRIADWFGVSAILCSTDCADHFAPKVVQATMGSLARVKVVRCNLPEVLASAGIPIYGTFLDGENIYQTPLSATGIIVMGNEGNGISKAVEPLVSHRISIPRFPADKTTPESLNVAIATAVTLAEFRRNGGKIQ